MPIFCVVVGTACLITEKDRNGNLQGTHHFAAIGAILQWLVELNCTKTTNFHGMHAVLS